MKERTDGKIRGGLRGTKRGLYVRADVGPGLLGIEEVHLSIGERQLGLGRERGAWVQAPAKSAFLTGQGSDEGKGLTLSNQNGGKDRLRGPDGIARMKK